MTRVTTLALRWGLGGLSGLLLGLALHELVDFNGRASRAGVGRTIAS